MRSTLPFSRSYYYYCGLCLITIALTLPARSLAVEKIPLDTPKSDSASNSALFDAAHAVFKRHCFECHGATKQKGDYRIDLSTSYDICGESELAPIVAGKPDKSELFLRISLPIDDDEVMPPKKKARPSPAEINAVKQWITSGAEWLGEDARSGLPSSYVEIGNEVTNAMIHKINETEAKAEYNAWGDNSVRVDLGVVDQTKLTDALEALHAFKDRLSWLDCSHLDLPESFYPTLSQYPKLQRLHLDFSNVSDADLAVLSQLPELRYLNLYSTQITDQGIPALIACKSLEKIFLSYTKITPQGMNQLQSALPDLSIIYQKEE